MRPARRERLIVFAVAFGVYATTLYAGVGGRFNCGDAAKWQFIGRILGIPHPPGSPLYVLVSHVWATIPVPFAGDDPSALAIRVNLLSAVFGALAATCVFGIARRIGLHTRTAALAVLFFALSEAVWTFSTEAEVYAPLAFASAFVLERALAFEATRKDHELWLLFLAYATGFGFHYMMITLLPALVVFLLRTDTRAVLRLRHVAVALACIVVGLLPIAFLWYASRRRRIRSTRGRAPCRVSSGTSSRGSINMACSTIRFERCGSSGSGGRCRSSGGKVASS